MKFVLRFTLNAVLVSATVMLIHSVSRASGCGSYDNMRTVIQNDLVSNPTTDEFTFMARTPDTVIVKIKATGQELTLEWEKSEKYEERYDSAQFEKRDLLFEEGNGCGPIFRCVTGQVRLLVFNAKAAKIETFAFPSVVNAYSSDELRPAGRSLLPMWGSLKLDVPSLAEQGHQETNEINRTQCGYGSW